MRRVRYEHSGGPEVLTLEEVPVPDPGPGQLLVRVEAIGVTLPVVRKVRESAEPIPLGGEIAGKVVALGESVAGHQIGDRVTGLCCGHGYADYAVLDTAMATSIPGTATAFDAIALVRSGLVAFGALDAARAEPGESALITAAAGGVGHLAVQLARAIGAAHVVGAVSDVAKVDFVRSLGADEVVTYDEPSWGEPADYALDGVGGDLLAPAVAALAPGGRLVAYSSGGGAVSAYDLLVGSKSVIGFQIARIAREQPCRYESWRRRLWELFGTGVIRPVAHPPFPLEDVAAAHKLIEERGNIGKVMLVP
jgi:NADPH:quinone reductase-like Zn-dependent oxidoreductase